MPSGPLAPAAPVGRRTVLIHWTVSSYSGWGVYGLNLALAWANDPDLDPVCSRRMLFENIEVDPIRRRALAPFLRATRAFHDRLAGVAGSTIEVMHPMLAAVNADFALPRGAHDVAMTGQPTIAVTFFETPQLSPQSVGMARNYPLVVTGSTWNARVLAAHGVTNVCTVLQGIDPTLFHPAPRAGVLGNRFCVFSGGKLEYRKGQDIVLAAFARFAYRHPEALLVTAWHNPWPELARTLRASPLLGPVPFDADGTADVGAWVRAAGVSADQHLDLGPVPNVLMPTVLREMDAGLFANRCEGGTDLVAMECMACGIPTILSANTGHLDLIGEENCYPLTQQAAFADERAGIGAVPGWGESSVDEAVDALERIYADRTDASRRGWRGAELVGALTWSRTAARTKEIVMEFSGG